MVNPGLAARHATTADGERAVDRPAGGTSQASRAVGSDRVVVAVLAAGSLVLFAVATALRLKGLPLGDEPHYLVITQALAKYGSFDPTPVYENRDYWSYYPLEIEPHIWTTAGGQPVPTHNLGAPLLWLVPFLLFGRLGAHLVVLAASTLVVVNMYLLQRELGIARRYAALVTGLFVIGSPLYPYASMLFVEPIGALLVIYPVRVLLSTRPTLPRVAVASTALGYLPWVHGRYTAFTVVLGALLILRTAALTGRRSLWPYLSAVVPLGILVGTIEAFNAIRYDTLIPAPGNASSGEGLFQIPPYEGLAHLLLDGTFGLFPHFPLLALALPGFFLALRRGRLAVHVVLLATVLPYVGAMSTFGAWHGGFSPPARFLAVVAPVLAYYVAVTVQPLHHWLMTSAAAVTALVGFVMVAAADVGLARRFHEPVAPDQRLWFLTWTVGLVGGTALVWWAGRNRPPLPGPEVVAPPA